MTPKAGIDLATVSGVTGLLNWYVRFYGGILRIYEKLGPGEVCHRCLPTRVWRNLWGHGAIPWCLPVRAWGRSPQETASRGSPRTDGALFRSRSLKLPTHKRALCCTFTFIPRGHSRQSLSYIYSKEKKSEHHFRKTQTSHRKGDTISC